MNPNREREFKKSIEFSLFEQKTVEKMTGVAGGGVMNVVAN